MVVFWDVAPYTDVSEVLTASNIRLIALRSIPQDEDDSFLGCSAV
jgi:hypothetical protein